MGAHCCHSHPQEPAAKAQPSPAYRRVLWLALWINFAMFALEIGTGLRAESVSLLADSLDFFGDAANYALSLLVLGMSLQRRAQAALFKAASMAAFGLWVLGSALWHAWQGSSPQPLTMGWVGALALLANLSVAGLLYAYRDGDSNMRSVWLCTRNDALGNLAVLLAALGVFGSGGAWPDLAVAAVMAGLALAAAWQVLPQARRELRHAQAA